MARAQAPTVRRITRADDQFQMLQALLANRRKRHQQRRFVIQGVRPLSQAIAGGWPLAALIYDSRERRSRWATTTLATATVHTHYVLAPDLMRELSQKDDAAELLAVGVIPPRTLADVDAGPDVVVCVVDRMQSPGNLGSIIRSADAFGAHGVVVLGHAADPYDPQCVRASTGSLFSVPVVSVSSPADLEAWLDDVKTRSGATVVGTDEGGRPLRTGDVRPPVVLMFGSESRGLTPAATALCDDIVALPMKGTASSLNVAAAAAVFLYETTRPTPSASR